MSLRRTLSIFGVGSLAGLVALAFNFLLRLGGFAAFPPEAALNAFLRVIPASIEEPMVQQFGDFAGQLGLLVATLIAAGVYGLVIIVFDWSVAKKVPKGPLTNFEVLLALGLVPWILYGLVVFPATGDSIFGVASISASTSNIWAFPFALLLVQGVFAWVLSFHYNVWGAMAVAGPNRTSPDVTRRNFLEKGAIGIIALVGGLLSLGGLSQLFSSQIAPTGGSQPINLQNAPAIFRDPRLANLVDSEVTPNNDFYRVAIDIIDPTVDSSTWSLAVDGLVNSPKTFSLEDLRSFPEASQYTTFECVSNNVNGNLISNAKWGGVKISDLLANAGGAQPNADYVVFYSVDGYSVGIPIQKAMMADSILAFNMNDEVLPTKHGYPLRGVIPGLYGMMSAKWVKRMQVVGSHYQGYWQTRGWTNDATIYTETFIVTPESGQESISQNGGSIIIAGYAFAGDRGISKVEVSFDNGKTWEQAQLKQPISNLTWALWAFDWQPPSTGEYMILARATDGAGDVQTAAVAGTFPNGATGYVAKALNVVS